MSAAKDFAVMGWCPGALRPMMSGDGLVVRVRPRGGRLTQAQTAGVAAAAAAHGNGLIDLSSRGNVQLRGVSEATHGPLIDDLRAFDLIDADAQAEARRNVLVTPFSDAGTDDLAARLGQALGDAPALPAKFGFAVDCGPAPVMQDIAADIRLERAADGGLILRCDGSEFGARVSDAEAPALALALAQWFVDAGGVTDGRGRMAALAWRGLLPAGILAGTVRPATAAASPAPGLVAQGALVGFAFGQMQADTLTALAALGDLRVTPWRMLLVEGLRVLPDIAGLIVTPDDPLRRVVACTGAPGCLQAHGPVRDLARKLAPQLAEGQLLHVSGCAKGCAHPTRADVTLVASPQGFDLIQGGCAQDAADIRGLTTAQVIAKGSF
ncbi:MAG: precorrin-3B synthase [Paracoccaceae bacterium]